MMLLRQLPYVWWANSYPTEHKTLLSYAQRCMDAGISWENHLRLCYQQSPYLLHPALVRLCKELGMRMFSVVPAFEVGDGASIEGLNGYLPVTITKVQPKLIVAKEDVPCVNSTSGTVLYLPMRGNNTHYFTRRVDGTWKVRGSRSHTKLILGRNFKPIY